MSKKYQKPPKESFGNRKQLSFNFQELGLFEERNVMGENTGALKDIKDIIGREKLRDYQLKVLSSALERNTLVVAPTGSGKTLIGFHYMINTTLGKGGRAVFLAPTTPLVRQHYEKFPEESKALLIGSRKRSREDYEKRYLFATPETLVSDIRKGIIPIDEISSIVFDEAHHATGNYAYSILGRAFHGKVLGLTASPGNRVEQVLEVCRNLRIIRIEHIRQEDLLFYANDIQIIRHNVGFPPRYKEALDMLAELKFSIEKGLWPALNNLGIAKPKNQRELINVWERLRKVRGANEIKAGYWALRKLVQIIDTFGVYSIDEGLSIFQSISKSNLPGDKLLFTSRKFCEAISILFSLQELGIEHPKMEALVGHLGEKTMVFTGLRRNAEIIARRINEAGHRAEVFLGTKTGYTIKQRREALNRFSSEDVNVLVCTHVGEEGIDIGSVGRVIFYDMVPSVRRYIQRMGRTGRNRKGEAVLLVALGTRDEAYFYSSKRGAESGLAKIINRVNTMLSGEGVIKNA